jgi:hypothetical protein
MPRLRPASSGLSALWLPLEQAGHMKLCQRDSVTQLRRLSPD